MLSSDGIIELSLDSSPISALLQVSDGEFVSSVLVYMSQPYSEAMTMHPSVTYTPCATSSWGEIGNDITLTQFEEGGLLSETRNDAESGDESEDDSIMPPLLSKEEMDTMDYGDESDHDPIST